MIRYKYGPFDNRYYVLVGGLVGRGLAEYDRDELAAVLADHDVVLPPFADDLHDRRIRQQLDARHRREADLVVMKLQALSGTGTDVAFSARFVRYDGAEDGRSPIESDRSGVGVGAARFSRNLTLEQVVEGLDHRRDRLAVTRRAADEAKY